MSKYTAEVRFICETSAGLSESVGYTSVQNVLDKCWDKVVDFDFPIFDENYRKSLVQKILRHYYTREIGFETVGLWKLKLQTKLNEIMPYYNKLYESELLEYNPLYATNLTRKHSGTDNVKSDSSNSSSGSGTNNNSNLDAYSDTPQNGLNDVSGLKYLTSARSTTDNATSTSNSNGSSNSNVDSTTEYLETVVGYEGKDVNEMLLKYRETLINIDVRVINDLEDLFFQLW